MATGRADRQLAAIMVIDVVGYSRLMGANEEGTLAVLKNLKDGVVSPQVAAYRGRIVKVMGDGAIIIFASIVDAVNAAVAVQQAMARSISFRFRKATARLWYACAESGSSSSAF